MDPYMLGWPGLPYIPVFIRHPDTGKMYWRQNPLYGEDFSYTNNVEHRYVRLKVVLQLFPSVKRAMAEEVLMDLVREYGIKPIHWDNETHCNYVHVSALLAFLTVFPYCASFQLARGSILHFLTYYMETQCLNCGFIHRDCTCDGVHENSTMQGGTGSLDIVAKLTDLTDKAIQTDPAELFFPLPGSSNFPPPPPLTAIPNGQLVPSGGEVQNVPSSALPQPPPLSLPPSSVPPVTIPSLSGPMQMPLWLPQGMKLTPGDRIPLSCVPGSQGQMMLRPQGLPWVPGNGPPVPQFRGGPYNMSAMGNFSTSQPLGVNGSMSLPQETSQGSLSNSINSSPMPSSLTTSPSKIRPIILRTNTGMSPSKENTRNASVKESLKWPQKSYKSSQSGSELNSKKNVVKTKYVKEITIGPDGKERITWVLKPVASSGWEVDTWKRKKKQVRPVHKTDSNFRLLSKDELKKSPRKSKIRQKLEKGKVESTKNKAITMDTADSAESSGVGDATLTTKSELDKSPQENCATSKKDDAGQLNVKDTTEKSVSETENLCQLGKPLSDIQSSNNVDDSSGSKTNTTVMPKHNNKEAVVENTDGTKESSSKNHKSETDKANKDSQKDNAGDKNKSPKKYSESEHTSEGEKSMDASSAAVDECSADAGKGNKEKPVQNVQDEVKHSVIDSCAEKGKKMGQGNVADGKTEGSPKSGDNCVASGSTEDLPQSECNNAEESGCLSGEEDEFGRPKKTYAKFEFLPTGDRMLRCILYTCGQCFDTETVAKVHARVHGYDRPNECRCYKCNYTGSLNQSADMLRHLWETHGERFVDTPRNHVPCKLCGLTFPTQEKFEEHEMFHYYNRYKCVFCGSMMYTWKQVQLHLEKCLECDKGQVYHHCPYCLLSFRDEAIRIAHIKSHQDKGLICMACKDDKVWDSWKLLKSHYTMFHLDIAPKRIFRCTKCTMTFTAQKTFRKHVKKHELQKASKKKKVPTATLR